MKIPVKNEGRKNIFKLWAIFSNFLLKIKSFLKNRTPHLGIEAQKNEHAVSKQLSIRDIMLSKKIYSKLNSKFAAEHGLNGFIPCGIIVIL